MGLDFEDLSLKQLIGFILICIFSAAYLFFVVFVYRKAKPELIVEMKSNVKRRVAIRSKQFTAKDLAALEAQSIRPSSVRSTAPPEEEQRAFKAKKRAKSVVDLMLVKELEEYDSQYYSVPSDEPEPESGVPRQPSDIETGIPKKPSLPFVLSSFDWNEEAANDLPEEEAEVDDVDLNVDDADQVVDDDDESEGDDEDECYRELHVDPTVGADSDGDEYLKGASSEGSDSIHETYEDPSTTSVLSSSTPPSTPPHRTSRRCSMKPASLRRLSAQSRRSSLSMGIVMEIDSLITLNVKRDSNKHLSVAARLFGTMPESSSRETESSGSRVDTATSESSSPDGPKKRVTFSSTTISQDSTSYALARPDTVTSANFEDDRIASVRGESPRDSEESPPAIKKLKSFSVVSTDLLRNPNIAAKVTAVQLVEQSLDMEDLMLLASGLAGSTFFLRELSLRNCELRDFEAALIARALLGNTELKRLDLSGNRIGKEGCAVIAALFGYVDLSSLGKISSKNASTKSLSASYKDIDNASFGGQAEKLLQTEEKTSLEDAPSNQIPSTQAEQTRSTENYNTSIRELNLSGNRIGPSGASFLAKSLSANETLTSLDISYQRKGFKIGPEGAHKFADLLGNPGSHLLTFKCARNNIGFEGCRHISSAIFRNTRLTELDVGGVNYLTIAGALQLGQAIKCNKSSHLAWLTVGEHRIPIQPLIGRSSYRASVDTSALIRDAINQYGLKTSANSPNETDSDLIPSEKSVAGDDLDAEHSAVYFQDTPDPHSVHVKRIETEESIQYREKAFVATTRHGMDDELGVVLATLITHNKQLHTLQVEEAKLPVQELIGNNSSAGRPAKILDLSGMRLTSIDAIIIGSLIAENSHLKLINLRDNCFGGTEGENFVAYALERNPGLKLNTEAWSPAQMYSDGYPALAALEGMSASGVTIEPQRLEGWFYQGLTVLSAILFYTGLVSDIATIFTFSSHPQLYFSGWVIFLALIMCTPTAVYLFNTLRNMLLAKPREALFESFIIFFQFLPAILAYRAVRASMESAALLDFKFVTATQKSIPQIYFQSFIMFAVGIAKGAINYWSLVSVLSSLLSITVIFIMLFDRKAARRMSMAPLSDQPYCAVVVARIFEMFGMGTTNENVKDFVNFDAFYTSHYCLSYVYQLAGLVPRIVSISWLLACQNSVYGAICIGIAVFIRIVVLCLHDSATYHRSVFNNIIIALSLVISDSAWHFDPADPGRSFDTFISVTCLSSVEVIILLLYTLLITTGSAIPFDIQLTIFVTMIIGILLRWLTLFGWAVRVHFPQLYLKNKRRGSVFVVDNSGKSSFAFGWSPFRHNRI